MIKLYNIPNKRQIQIKELIKCAKEQKLFTEIINEDIKVIKLITEIITKTNTKLNYRRKKW